MPLRILALFFITFLLTTTIGCIKPIPLAEESPSESLLFNVQNHTGGFRTENCGEGLILRFTFSNGQNFKEEVIGPSSGGFILIEIKAGETLSVRVFDENDTEVASGSHIINTDNDRVMDSFSRPPNTIELCPKDQLTFINF